MEDILWNIAYIQIVHYNTWEYILTLHQSIEWLLHACYGIGLTANTVYKDGHHPLPHHPPIMTWYCLMLSERLLDSKLNALMP